MIAIKKNYDNFKKKFLFTPNSVFGTGKPNLRGKLFFSSCLSFSLLSGLTTYNIYERYVDATLNVSLKKKIGSLYFPHIVDLDMLKDSLFKLSGSLVESWDTFKYSNLIFNNNLLFDAPFFKQYLFQDPGTDIMEYMVEFHHDITFIMFLFFILVL